MHEATIELLEPSHLKSAWTSYQDGKAQDPVFPRRARAHGIRIRREPATAAPTRPA